MEYKINTTIIADSIKNQTLMPYFLHADNEFLFKENMKELYSQLEQESPLALVYNNKPISEETWNETKFVGSFFTLYFHIGLKL